jgi:diguanylate cyclase (GGDEF)-like protein/PAS domain S-box-containing protein
MARGPAMSGKLKILFVEDERGDVELEMRALRRAGMDLDSQHVATEAALHEILGQFKPQIVISDFSLPGFDGLTALAIVRGVYPDTPLIFVSGTIGEERAIEAIRHGATDYVLKDNLTRLPPAVQRAVRESEERAARLQAERELSVTRERLDNILASLDDVIWSLSADGNRLLFVNPAVQRVYGRPPEDFLNDTNLWHKAVHPDDRQLELAAWDSIFTQGTFECEYRVVRPDREVVWVRERANVRRDESGKILRIDGITTDITAQKTQQQRLEHMTRLYAVLSGINAAIVRTEDRQALLNASCRILTDIGHFRLAAFGEIDTGRRRFAPVTWAGAAENYLAERFGGGVEDEVGNPVWANLLAGRPFVCNDAERSDALPLRTSALRHGLRSFAVLPMEMDAGSGLALLIYAGERDFFNAEEVQLLKDLVEDLEHALAHIAQQTRLDYLVTHDPLTGLPNREGLINRIRDYLNIALPQGVVLPLLLLDVDRFSNINLSLGRHVADAVLREVAARLRNAAPQAICLARIDADQFAVVLPPTGNVEALARFVQEELLPAYAPPLLVPDHSLTLSVRAGIALAPIDGTDADLLVVNAVAASDQARQAAEHVAFHSHATSQAVARKLTLENKLRRALAERQFLLYYQPILDIGDRRIVGVEALLRWRDPDTGIVEPAHFIPLLEETGLIIEVGSRVLEQALDDLREMHKADPGLHLAVNVSRLQLRRPEFIAETRQQLDHHRALSRSLVFEITESVVMHDPETTAMRLAELRAMGIGIAIDDFGTGYSSMNLLSKLPIDILKIDRSFISNMLQNPADRALVSTMVMLAHTLKLRVVAEGVDADAQREMLLQMGCDQLQGYLFSPPLPPDELLALLRPVTAGGVDPHFIPRRTPG